MKKSCNSCSSCLNCAAEEARLWVEKQAQVWRESVTMIAKRDNAADNQVQATMLNEAQSPYKDSVWRRLTPRERLRRSWEMRSRLPDPRAVHDRKLFPKP